MKRSLFATLKGSVGITLGVLLLMAGAVALAIRAVPSRVEARFGKVIHEVRSPFSEIRVREKGSQRALLFVDEDGAEACQSAIDLANPSDLPLAYTRGMFISLAHGDLPKRVLIVGLGGGGMVRFLEEVMPDLRIEAVEIDPEVVRIAQDYFGVGEGDRVAIHTADAFDFFGEEHGAYDCIYMDAFLRAPESSGLNEKARRLKTSEFLEEIKAKMAADGVIAFNLIAWDERTPGDLESIGAVFPGLKQYPVPGTGNLIIIAPAEGPAPDPQVLVDRAAVIDRELPLGFSLGEVISWQTE